MLGLPINKNSESPSRSSHRFYDPHAHSTNSPDKLLLMTIKNTDWYDSEIRKTVENNQFEINQVSLLNPEEIAKNLKQNSDENSVENTIQIENKNDEIRDFIIEILESKNDCLIKYNEIDSLLTLIKDRFSDFKRSQYIMEFFKSASFTLYILNLNL